jgi:hypothetical protein
MLKKESHHVRRDIDHRDLVNLFPYVLSNKGNQQTTGVPVAALRIPGQIALGHQIFNKERRTHGPRRLVSVIAALRCGVTFEAHACLMQEFWRHSEIHLGCRQMRMPHVNRQLWQ